MGVTSAIIRCAPFSEYRELSQRIGRAGRATWTALIVSVVNQRPHDLFFGRPEMCRASRSHCWLDASAVLVRQFLAFVLIRHMRGNWRNSRVVDSSSRIAHAGRSHSAHDGVGDP
jgi:DEAD/DEAH box helicase domain-containing protein